MYAAHAEAIQPDRTLTVVERLNGPYHELALRVFTVIVLAHWAEHLLQAFQIYALGWPVPEARGLLGQFYPWLVKSETLHYGYALVMLAGLWILRPGFTGFFGRPVPTSLVQLWVPRVELHLFYNTIVFIPMMIAMYYHLFPPPGEHAEAGRQCTCAWQQGLAAAG